MDQSMQKMTNCGRFHVAFVFLTQLPRFCIVWGLYIMMFGAYTPPWRCVSETADAFQNSSSALGQSITSSTKHESFSSEGNESMISFPYNGSCKIDKHCKTIDFEPGSSTVVSEFGLICDKSWIASFIISMQMFAVMPGAYMGGQIGERFGRKVSLYGSTLLLCAALVIGQFSVAWEMYLSCSFVIGLGGGGILSTSVVYSMEFLDHWWRAVFSAIPVWNISMAAFSVVILWLRDWRLIHIAAAVVSGLSLLGVFWVPESLRWLYVHGKQKKAHKVMIKICKTNDLESSAKDLTCNAMITEETEDKIANRAQHMTYLDLFRDPYVRSVTGKATTAWTGILIVYISLGYGIKSLHGDFYVNAIIASVTEVPVMLLLGPLANKLGRRLSTLSFYCLTAISCGAVVAVHYSIEGNVKGDTITILAIIAKACASTAWCGMSTMSVELYPTVIRNLGYGFLSLVSGIGGVIAPYLIPEDASWFGIYFSIMVAVLVICVVMVLSLPETKGRDLPDTIYSEMCVEETEGNRILE